MNTARPLAQPPWWKLSGALALIGLLIACASEDSLQIPIERFCEVPDDCGGAQMCISGQCIDPSNIGPESVHIEITPRSGSGYVRTQFLNVSLDEGQRLALTLPAPLDYEAVVLQNETPIAARLTLEGLDRIPRRTIDISRTLDPTDPQSSRFQLLDGLYNARIAPEDSSLPSISVAELNVRRRSGVILKEFSVPERYREVCGRVLTGLVSSSTLAGARVEAISEKSGLTSTASISNAQGEYCIQLPHTGKEDTSFRLVATPPEGMVLWGFEQRFIANPGEDRELQVLLEAPAEHRRGTAELRVLGQSSDGLEPIRNAHVTLTATAGQGRENARYRVQGTTDADGQLLVTIGDDRLAEFPILGSRYVATVEPPIGSAFARIQTELDLSQTGVGTAQNAQLVLSPRTKVEGRISSKLGRPVSRAEVEFEPLNGEGRSSATNTDARGSFSIDLEPGAYLMTVYPQDLTDENELVPTFAQLIQVEAQLQDSLPLLNLPGGAFVQGQITGEFGEALREPEIEFFIELGGQTISLGRSQADVQGFFSIVLPEPPR